jgi:GNAT superfamily N-acetyltransferase
VIHIRRMTAADIPFGMRLKDQERWNQTEADWQRYLNLEPDGCFVAELGNETVATTTTCVFGAVGWIAMVLVDVHLRGRGIGSALMRHALAYLDERGVLTARLDATPLGQPVYEKLGFISDYALVRHVGVLPARDAVPQVKCVRPEELDRLCELDRSITYTDRGKLLIRLFHEQPEHFRMVRDGDDCVGFLATRPRAIVLQIGPCIATPRAGPLLVADACSRLRHQHACIDIPTDNGAATTFAESLGLKPQRRLMRMHRGKALLERIPMLWASSGPEMG